MSIHDKNSGSPIAVCTRALLVLAVGGALAACAASPRFQTTYVGAASSTAGLARDGVLQLLPSSGGIEFVLGDADPNDARGLEIEKGTRALKGQEGPLSFWTLPSYELDYSSGGTGKTSRLHIQTAHRLEQRYTWQSTRGYLARPDDLRDQELTVYVRPHGIFDPERAAISLKVRGGRHTKDMPDLSSCVMLTLQFRTQGKGVTRFGKELAHPDYDYVKLKPFFEHELVENRWVGMKMVTYNVPGDPRRVVNRLYLDTEPFDDKGQPRNNWRLFSEYVDEDGKSTGEHYTRVASWGGWQTTVRTDGIDRIDFVKLSARAVTAPAVAMPALLTAASLAPVAGQAAPAGTAAAPAGAAVPAGASAEPAVAPAAGAP